MVKRFRQLSVLVLVTTDQDLQLEWTASQLYKIACKEYQ